MFTRRYTNFWDGLFRPSKTHLLGSSEVKTLTNLVTNGDFSNGTTGWVAVSGSTFAVANNTGASTGTGAVQYPAFQQTIGTGITGHVYAVRYNVRVTTLGCLNLY